MKLNNLYNFKNTVKHFLNIDSVLFPDSSLYSIKNLCWTKPIIINIHKQEDEYRTIKMPNILNFKFSYEHFEDMPNFNCIHNIDTCHKRLSANIDTGDFVSGEFDLQLQEDFNNLCVYDNLLKLDISKCYNSIYTHYLGIESPHNEQFLSNLNCGATNGLILGNYISLYFAETYLSKISNDIEMRLNENNIDCEFSYFSDDFYFFCNEHDNQKIINLFCEILTNYNLECNIDKKKIWTYETYNNYNIVSRYWKKTVALCNINYKQDKINKFYFLNQIIYRMSKLSDEKQKKVFINSFFKTNYFQKLDMSKFAMRNFDYHQLGFIFKYSPEAIIYSLYKFTELSTFKTDRLMKFFGVRYKESLTKQFHEEQLYYYFANKLLNFETILQQTADSVLKTKNQILISYYLKDNLFNSDQITILKSKTDECLWFQNYHLILYTDLLSNLENSITTYLIPDNATKQIQQDFYFDFYNQNLSSSIPLIKDIEDVQNEIFDYLDLRIQESEEVFRRRMEHSN